MRQSSSSAFQPGASMPCLSAAVHSRDMKDAEINFRCRISESELREVRCLHREWFPVDYSDEFYQSLTSSTDVLSVVADIGGLIVGLATVSLCDTGRRYGIDRDLAWSNEEIQVAYILTLGVIDELRKRGIASQLLCQTIKEIQARDTNCSVVALHVIEYNRAAMRLYEKNGFTRFKIEPNFYRLGDTWFSGILFYRSLEQPASDRLLVRLVQWLTRRVATFFRLLNSSEQSIEIKDLETV